MPKTPASVTSKIAWALPAALVAVACGMLSGCAPIRDGFAAITPFYSIPREQGAELSTRPIEPFSAFPRPPDARTRVLDVLEGAAADELASLGSSARPGADHRLVAEFLTISDLHLRDEEVYAEGRSSYINRLVYFDRYVAGAIRRSFVERFDATTLASFLIGYRKEAAYEAEARRRAVAAGTADASVAPFIVHTGDLLDISTSTELLSALTIVRGCLPPGSSPPFCCVAGNHDGQVFGAVENRRADMRMLGVNLAEFVLGHLRMDPAYTADGYSRGFGFGANEIIRRFHPCSPGLEAPASGDGDPVYEPGWKGQAARQARDLIAAAIVRSDRDASQPGLQNPAQRDSGTADPLRLPIVFSSETEVDDRADGGELQLGYYHWDQPLERPVGGLQGIRYLVLDTRRPGSLRGWVGLVQLGWLYNQLADALARRYAVVIFAHHGPRAMARPFWGLGLAETPNTRIFHRLLTSFPNIVAYFHGHQHWNEQQDWPTRHSRFPVIQTGSLCDFPQVGRKVRIYATQTPDGACTARVVSDFVRPRVTATDAGDLVGSLLRASQSEALREFNDATRTWAAVLGRLTCGYGLWAHLRPQLRPIEAGWEEWRRAHLRSEHTEVPLSFDTPRPRSSLLSGWPFVAGARQRGPLDAASIFGAARDRASRMRNYLGLAPILSASRIEAKEAAQ
ncbi:MAG TPA: hypothetical protein VNE39_18510 [Planctomycetota bacterium]|nr:hypothetical protein [Planctomycetota bacterium]